MNEHILLVDDDASVRATLRTCLEATGYQCIEVEDGDDARTWLEQGHPVDLIVTDHQMPRVTGHGFGAYHRSEKSRKDQNHPNNFL